MLLTKQRQVDKYVPIYLDKYHKEVENVKWF
jgi:hypothetical protein